MRNDACSMALLFDYYGELLTERQRDFFDQYYNQDLSLAEIAENEGVSRQSVHDTLHRTEEILRNFEEKTGCVARAAACRETLREIRTVAERMKKLPGGEALAEELLASAERIK
ncbi:MAG: YlxM family DNA-binding protein [Oscillospiraceae bacterium]|nr:YlxM family DNA-binding protein [Oscillospiraceae bacterium]